MANETRIAALRERYNILSARSGGIETGVMRKIMREIHKLERQN